jgi:hypothetical protein
VCVKASIGRSREKSTNFIQNSKWIAAQEGRDFLPQENVPGLQNTVNQRSLAMSDLACELNSQRILAVDIRPRSFAFVVFEGPIEILDWGARSFRRGVNTVRVPLRPKMAALIDQYVPEAIVLKYPRTRRANRILQSIRLCAKGRNCAVRVVSQKAVPEIFPASNKHQIATAIAERFPDLLSILPPKRKAWQSEDYRMSVFDAAAIGIAFFTRGMRAIHSTFPPSS